MSIELMMPSDHHISAIPFSSCLQTFPASGSFLMSQIFTTGGQIIGLQLQHQSFRRIFRLFSFRFDWCDLCAVQGSLKSLLQHHSSKASVLQQSAFFIVQLSHPYMTTEKPIAFSIQTFAGKVISLLFNTLSRFVIPLLPWSKHASSNFMAAVIIHSNFGAQEKKMCHCFYFFPFCLQ